MQRFIISASIGIMAAALFISVLVIGIILTTWRSSLKDKKKEKKNPVEYNENKSTQVAFLTSSQPSEKFVELLEEGLFSCIITGNHGGDFPDKKQCDNFKKYATKEICDKIFSIEVSNEKFVI